MLDYTTLDYSTLVYTTLDYSTLDYSTLVYSTLVYSTLVYSTLVYSTLVQNNSLYEVMLVGTNQSSHYVITINREQERLATGGYSNGGDNLCLM